jgi:hypothetical protein
LLGATAFAVFGYYVSRLGHGPDWYGYVEAALGVRGGVVALPIDWGGPVAVLVATWWAIAGGVVVRLRTAVSPGDLAPTCAALGLLWVMSSYFIGRSHSLIVTDLLPALLLVGLVMLREVPSAAWLRTLLVATFAGILMFAVQDRSGWVSRKPLLERWGMRVDQRRPTLDATLMELLRKAGITPGSAIAYCDMNVMPAWPPTMPALSPDRVWLPIQPLTELVVVRPERRALYIRRSVERLHSGGWLIENSVIPCTRTVDERSWLFGTLAETHHAVRMVENGAWRATYYEFVGEHPAASPVGGSTSD